MEKIAIIKPKNFKKGKISCGICDFILTNSLDIISSDTYDCCEECRIKWVEARKDEYSTTTQIYGIIRIVIMRKLLC